MTCRPALAAAPDHWNSTWKADSGVHSLLITWAPNSLHYLPSYRPQALWIMSHSHDTTASTNTTATSMMVPYLHFTGGDYLFFDVWQPKSPGALAGACIGLIVLALFERWLAATRVMFASYWQHRFIYLVHSSLRGHSCILCCS